MSLNRLIALNPLQNNTVDSYQKGVAHGQNAVSRDLLNTSARNTLDRQANTNRLLQSNASPQEVLQSGDMAGASDLLKVRSQLDNAKQAEFDAGIKNMAALTSGIQDMNDPAFGEALMRGVDSGLYPEQAMKIGLSLGPEAIKRLNGEISGSGSVQFGGQQTFKDEAGNMYFGTTKRNPQTGAVESVLAPIGGAGQPQGKVSLVSNLGLTAPEVVQQKAVEQGVVGKIKTQQAVDQARRLETETQTQKQALDLNRIKIDETKESNIEKRQVLIDAKATRRREASSAIDQIDGLLKGDRFTAAFGKVVSATPDLLKSQESLDAIAEKDQIIGLLSLESRQKLKGQGTITDSEAKTLEKSATVLANPLISDELAEKELIKVRGIFQEAAMRNRLKEGSVPTPPQKEFTIDDLVNKYAD